MNFHNRFNSAHLCHIERFHLIGTTYDKATVGKFCETALTNLRNFLGYNIGGVFHLMKYLL